MADELDYMAALRTFLVDALAAHAQPIEADKIFVGGIKKGTISSRNPSQAVTLNMSGGVPSHGQVDNLPVVHQRFDVICYGETRYEANALYRKVASILRGLTRQIVDGVLLNRIVKAGGVLSLIDDETDLPIEVQSFELAADIA